jgi:uncharacterized protein YecT (DUF1311 family)
MLSGGGRVILSSRKLTTAPLNFSHQPRSLRRINAIRWAPSMLTRFGLLLLACFSTLSVADTLFPRLWDFADEQKQKCSQGNMREMNQCLADAYAESDARLNVVYRHLLKALEDPAPLQKAQSAWVRFRDLQCAFEVPPSWEGSGVPYSRNSCLIDHTERRIRDIERVIPCNGCVEFKPEFYAIDKPYKVPPR